ncbi:MAG: ABC transporter ATP-binding protein [Thermodesulfobacteriota bacterium]|nr:ABC transporter ATP-binding protein [Thermodesulfobacteriota bacterium]
MALLEVENLSVGYNTRNGYLKAVERVSFDLEEGKSLGFVGESGCGKTTIGAALMGLLPPNGSVREGRIIFEGTNLIEIPEGEMRKIRWGKIAMIFQAAMNALNPVHRVDNQIAEAILTHHPELGKEEALRQVKGLFQTVGIPEMRMRDYPHQYSGGMKQRAIIAMALACRPKLIIADEPTTALDVIVQDQILDETKILQKEFNVSMLFISHDISIVADVCSHIAVMYAGQIVEYGHREAVFNSPAHPYTKALISSYPTLTGKKSHLIPIPGETPNLIHPPPGCRFCERCTEAGSSCKAEPPLLVEIDPGHKALCHSCG